MRIYRDWWDPTYTSEASYIENGGFSMEPMDSKPFRIPRMRALLNAIYPGTQFSITEWSAEIVSAADFSTALGDADAYGILGRERVYLASRWEAPDPAQPQLPGSEALSQLRRPASWLRHHFCFRHQ